MSKKGPVTPKGFRDIEPELAKKRRKVISTIASVLERFGFVPLETPTLEFAETLLGKYGEDEKLIYKFTDRGGRNLALRYDFTVPLARYIANNLGVLNPTFSRYQVGQVFRGEKPQKGRYREFMQFDLDVVGSEDPKEDAKIIAAVVQSTKKLGLKRAKMAVNDRKNFEGLDTSVIKDIDKIYKVGEEETKKKIGKEVFKKIKNSGPTDRLKQIFTILEKQYSLVENKDFYFDPFLARGLDYYTSTIFELKPNGKMDELSAAGGGRYDDLIGMFAQRKIPAVGIAFGVDRLTELADI